jgi:hypothetical protein
MNKLSTLIEAIVKNNGATPQDWKTTASLINSKADE